MRRLSDVDWPDLHAAGHGRCINGAGSAARRRSVRGGWKAAGENARERERGEGRWVVACQGVRRRAKYTSMRCGGAPREPTLSLSRI